jgi:hypothetical protein
VDVYHLYLYRLNKNARVRLICSTNFIWRKNQFGGEIKPELWDN